MVCEKIGGSQMSVDLLNSVDELLLSSRDFLVEQETKAQSKESIRLQLEEIDKELELEYKDGETCWAANLEAERERTEEAICLLEENYFFLKSC